MALATPSKVRLTLAVCLCTLLHAAPAQAMLWGLLQMETAAIQFPEWTPETGDSFLVDRQTNVGYLLHENGGYTSFPVATGQQRVVHYIGRTYNAATPLRSWKVLSEETKGDHITFGKFGRFLRLSKEDTTGLEETPYGIHSHAYAETMLSSTDRYRSMGCIIVSEHVLDIVVQTFELNGKSLSVQTVDGLGDEAISEDVLRQKMGML